MTGPLKQFCTVEKKSRIANKDTCQSAHGIFLSVVNGKETSYTIFGLMQKDRIDKKVNGGYRDMRQLMSPQSTSTELTQHLEPTHRVCPQIGRPNLSPAAVGGG